ncbi:MAG: threonine--tRNA ligase [archaeon]|nr:MAG: threonine--tRNA ligase [archaeon]
MKILTLHCDYINFKPLKKALKEPEKTEKKEVKVKECLVVLTAVEKRDQGKNVLKLYLDNIKDIAKQVKAKTIVLYPYAHLSSDLASPSFAEKLMKDAEKQLKGFKVFRAPFGWYKEFELKCKGHPLSELSREITAEGKVKETFDCKQLLRQISKSRLDNSKLKENDHRVLGQKLDLFSFHDVAPGMIFWHPKGTIIRNELIKFWREEHRKAGYKEILTPEIMDKKLWQISGHWDKYSENNFLTDYEKRTFLIKPMNCPGGMLVYKATPKSYRDLPLRVGELGTVHRQELSGVLGGIFRVVQFTQDDAHIYCTEKQLEDEVIRIIDLVELFYKKFKLPHRIELSTRPKKRIGTDKQWDKAEKVLESVLKKKRIKYKLNKGDGAFYGPKIDFHVTDSLKRDWQLATIQLDFAMPERFELEYTDENNKKQIPVVLHRTVLGALGRFIGILLEHTNGNLPTWLAPVQVRVLSFTERNVKTAKKTAGQLSEFRVETDFRNLTIQRKIRDAETEKVPYTILIGDKEEKNKTIALRKHGSKPQFGVKIDSFIKNLKQEIENRK